MASGTERPPSPRTRDGRAYWRKVVDAAEADAVAHGVSGEIRLRAAYPGDAKVVQLWGPRGPIAHVVGVVTPGVVEVSVDPAAVRQWLRP